MKPLTYQHFLNIMLENWYRIPSLKQLANKLSCTKWKYQRIISVVLCKSSSVGKKARRGQGRGPKVEWIRNVGIKKIGYIWIYQNQDEQEMEAWRRIYRILSSIYRQQWKLLLVPYSTEKTAEILKKQTDICWTFRYSTVGIYYGFRSL